MKKHTITWIMKYIFRHRKYVLIAWGMVLVLIGYGFLFYRDSLVSEFTGFFLLYPIIWYTLYFVIVSLRGLTFIPLTTILLIAIPFTNHVVLLILTLVGTLITSYIIYRFSEALDIDDYFEKKHPRAINTLRKGFEKYEFPIIFWWSLLPFTPTDLICYVAGTLKINISKMLLGIFAWEVIICILYIWGIKSLIM
jgi:uncharacterized membrane protein YdjX (TVP38/TMEM64 family)